MIRIAAVGDLHIGTDGVGLLGPHLRDLADRADVLLLAGDLTRCGDPDEASILVAELRGTDVPVVAVLGNHDHHAGRADDVIAILQTARVRVLDGDSTTISVNGTTLGIAGVKGFGGGFAGACGTDFGEPEMKAFIGHTRAMAIRLEQALKDLDTPVRVALLHYSPVEDTLQGERLEIFPFLGSYLLAEAIDAGGAHLAVHGHAHRGRERGITPGGVHVRNVAQPVIQQAYRVYCIDDDPIG
jgi:Icc-related predicted phosphoesterase